MSIIDAAKTHFRQKIGNELQCIDVPEWAENGEPGKIYFRPSINFLQQEKVIRFGFPDRADAFR